MRTYSLKGVVDLLGFIIDQEIDDDLWKLWLAKDITDDFVTFKKKRKQTVRKKVTVPTEVEEKALIAEYNITVKGGEMNE